MGYPYLASFAPQTINDHNSAPPSPLAEVSETKRRGWLKVQRQQHRVNAGGCPFKPKVLSPPPHTTVRRIFSGSPPPPSHI